METRSRKSCRSPTAARSRVPRIRALLAALALAVAWSAAGAAPAAPDNGASAAAIVGGAAPIAVPSGTDIYLDVTVNGGVPRVVHLSERDGELWAAADSLRRLHLRIPATAPELVRLAGLSGVEVAYDRNQQRVAIVAPLQYLDLPDTVLAAPEAAEPQASTAPGILLNYNSFASRSSGDLSQLSAFTEVRGFNRFGVLSTTALLQATNAGGHWEDRSTRLDTSLSSSFPAWLITVTLGDTLTAVSSWSRSDRIAGLQIGTNFALQPYRVTTPLPQFFGSATLPSQVELYVNGLKLYSGGVPAGQFRLNAAPNASSGAGQARLVLTDALGRVTTYNYALYNTPQLLRRGLNDWSVETGVVRRNYGFRSFDYGSDAVVSGTWRRGLTNALTVETHGEATAGLANGGAGATWLAGRFGVLTLSSAYSIARGHDGAQVSAGYSWVNNRFTVAAAATHASSGYRDIAALNGAPVPTLTASAQAAYSTRRFGSFGTSYVDLRYAGQPASRFVSAFWFSSLGRHLSLNVSANQDVARARSRSVFLTLNLTRGNGLTVTAGAQHGETGNSVALQASQSVPTAGGLGWRALVEQTGGAFSGRGEVDYLGRHGQFQVGGSGSGSSYSVYAGATGSVVVMGGAAFAARPITNGFALVSTDGVGGIPVLLQNNLVGTTDSRGKLLVTNLNAYQNNRLSIDPLHLAADLQVDQVDRIATPADRTGTLARFPITRVRAALLTLVDAAGQPLAIGSRVRINGSRAEPAVVGFDGVVYLPSVAASNVLTVETGRRVCYVRFNYVKTGDTIPQIGPLKCLSDYIATAGLP